MVWHPDPMTLPPPPHLIAHQGGWDEMLMFIVPIAVAFLAVRALERRSRRRDDAVDQDESKSQKSVP